MTLQILQAFLDEAGFQTYLKVADSEVILERLFILTPSDNEGRLILEIIPIPDFGKQLNNTQLLQFFVGVLVDCEKNNQEQLKKMILALNSSVPLMGWGLNEEENLVYFRHILVLPEAINYQSYLIRDVVVETTWLIFYIVDSYYSTLEAISLGASPPCISDSLESRP